MQIINEKILNREKQKQFLPERAALIAMRPLIYIPPSLGWVYI
jgi:hypothetical protein